MAVYHYGSRWYLLCHWWSAALYMNTLGRKMLCLYWHVSLANLRHYFALSASPSSRLLSVHSYIRFVPHGGIHKNSFSFPTSNKAWQIWLSFFFHRIQTNLQHTEQMPSQNHQRQSNRKDVFEKDDETNLSGLEDEDLDLLT